MRFQLKPEEFLIGRPARGSAGHIVNPAPKRLRRLHTLNQSVARISTGNEFEALVQGLVEHDRIEQRHQIRNHNERLAKAGPTLKP